MHELANREKLNFSDLVRDFYADQVVADIFEEEQAALVKQRDMIAQAQTALDHAEAAARGKAFAYRSAVQKRDLLSARLTRAGEQLAELRAEIPKQTAMIEASIGNVEKFERVDIGTIYILSERVGFLGKYHAAIPLVEEGIARLKRELAEAERAVEVFEKSKAA